MAQVMQGMKSIMSGSWTAQTTFPPLQQFVSERRKESIWRNPTTNSDRRCRVTDGELLRKLGSPQVDCFGNMITGRRGDMAKMLVERVLNGLSARHRQAVSARVKWQAVELIANGRTLDATKLLRETVNCA